MLQGEVSMARGETDERSELSQIMHYGCTGGRARDHVIYNLSKNPWWMRKLARDPANR
jgi:hypothetical protein